MKIRVEWKEHIFEGECENTTYERDKLMLFFTTWFEGIKLATMEGVLTRGTLEQGASGEDSS